MKIYIKIHENFGERILAACDSEIIGKKFFEKDLKLEAKEKFYKGSLVEIKNLKEELKKATIANLLGNKVVEFAIKNEFVDKNSIIEISGIKHAQIIVV